MKLLFIVYGDPVTRSSGTLAFVHDLVLELSKLEESKNAEIHILYAGKHKRKSEDKLPIFYHQVYTGNIPYLSAFKFAIRASTLFTELLNKHNFSAVVLFGSGAAPLVTKLSSSHSFLLIYYAIDCMVSEYLSRKENMINLPIIKKIRLLTRYPILVAFEKKACQKADLIFASSEETAIAIRKWYSVDPTKVNVLYFGVADKFALDNVPVKSNRDIIIFLLIATEHHRKGTIYLLEAMKILKEKKTDSSKIKAIIVGKRDPFYINFAKKLELNVEFVDEMPQQLLKTYYAQCDCLVVPSLSEGFCLPVIEAALFGKPSIVSDVGSLPELVIDGETGFIIKQKDAIALAEKMLLLASDPELVRFLGTNAKRNAQRFTIKNTAKQFIQYLSIHSTQILL